MFCLLMVNNSASRRRTLAQLLLELSSKIYAFMDFRPVFNSHNICIYHLKLETSIQTNVCPSHGSNALSFQLYATNPDIFRIMQPHENRSDFSDALVSFISGS